MLDGVLERFRLNGADQVREGRCFKVDEAPSVVFPADNGIWGGKVKGHLTHAIRAGEVGEAGQFRVWVYGARVGEEAASVGEPGIAVGLVFRAGRGKKTSQLGGRNLVGEDVLITGAGPIGIMAAAVARHVGARHVVITDVNEYRLELAKKMGVTRAVNVAEESLKDVMSELGMKEGFDVGLEMSGVPSAFSQMLATMNHGGKVAMLGIPPENVAIDWNEVIFKGLVIKGIYGREMFETWYKMASLLQSGLDISPILTHQMSVDDYEEGFETMVSGQSGKVILNWD